ncbi:hypothetical protein appser11_1680 [Actinobacillus pleuropneumoniae serovar 11 str. 56153]|uniref:Uncharacterized protein n=1 Tax=Actinobacillus pleuropneumoniae serovar 6 str. Femo TaxID=754256 RepID=A0A828PXM0_ACTPL|nr:hypothetical protein appser2_1310 [Actinobacillus pleuropneumoniae serovar 2 str. S1536]EFM92880.1 hypothetical protein appser6_1970 [Actinobacillus pleuropneumoniae serovar 6 str. Femo]EFM95057.1 hypothetical protein appser9_1690 [Actinobacillus pleuropneumoniae serovar 9 str. CVJ13261]EFM99396.1 hypothetical protein appser11_1680 [Actinobacillus pleuropneumoniae serovar 11 str. 56153]EFN01466.1 hypothetical protein appser12_1790 [Actinobacillus pleuropneumoniae serovar 12 str. 1096]EFN035
MNSPVFYSMINKILNSIQAVKFSPKFTKNRLNSTACYFYL